MFSIDVFRSMLRVDKHQLDAALEVQSETMERISSHTAVLNSRALELKKALDAEEAAVISELKANDAKLSNPLAEKEARRDSRYKAAWREWADARQEHEEWQGLLSAWTARGYNLKTLADLYSNQYFQMTSVTGSGADARLDAYETRRSAMRQASAPTTPQRRRIAP